MLLPKFSFEMQLILMQKKIMVTHLFMKQSFGVFYYFNYQKLTYYIRSKLLAFTHDLHSFFYKKYILKHNHFYFSLSLGNNNAAKILIRNGADLNITNIDGNLPLHYALEKGIADF